MSANYEDIDVFVDEMNESAAKVGDTSIYLFNKFRNGIGWIFIMITTVAISFIVAEFVRKFDVKEIAGVDLYWLAVVVGLLAGGYIAYWAESAKIATIKGGVFSEGMNRFYQLLASSAVIAVLIMVNANGVQKIADFSLRYMDAELQDSYLLKLKETKMNNHADVAKIDSGKSIGDTSVKMLMMSRDSLMRAKQNEISAIQSSYKAWAKGRDKHAYRTMIANRKIDTASKIAKIEDGYSKKIAKMDWKISQAESKVNDRIAKANVLRTAEMAKADEATKELETFYKGESAKNQSVIDEYKGIGLIVAVGGEVIDGILAFLLFVLVKSNPNTNGTPKVDRNTRALRPRVVAPAREIHTVSDFVAPQRHTLKESL